MRIRRGPGGRPRGSRARGARAVAATAREMPGRGRATTSRRPSSAPGPRRRSPPGDGAWRLATNPARGLAAPRRPPVPRTSRAPRQAVGLLERYLTELKTLRVSFLQTLTDAQGREIDRATGTLIVQRPGRFRWETHPQSPGSGGAPAGAGQLMVCDGTDLWFLDRDLGQGTVKPVAAAPPATPALPPPA